MYDAHVLVNGFPGRTSTHGSFGWSSVWLLRNADRVVVVDTGPPAYVPLITQALAGLGLSPRDVTDVLVTHAHWDHLGNVSLFPQARRWIGRAEHAWACRQATDVPFVSQPLLGALSEPEGALRLIDAEGEILPGIHAIDAAGHTPGHLAFLAHTVRTPLLFVGDAAKNVHELESSAIDSALDLAAGRQSISRIREIATSTGAAVVPGHDVVCTLVDGHWQRKSAQTAQLHFHHHRDAAPARITISDQEPGLVAVRSDDAI